MMKKSANAYKKGSRSDLSDQVYALAAAFGAIGLALSVRVLAPVLAFAAEPPHGESAITCTNPYSGASWQIRIDYDQHTVDTNPAQIGDATISWRDKATGWQYDLDRKSGKLTITLASSTGGNFLYDNCKL